jgi:chromosome segregation ATPase
MKRALLVLLVLISLGLCGICVVQWQREFRLRAHIAALKDALAEENHKRVEAEAKVEQYGQEIERLTSIRKEIEARLLDLTEEVRNLTDDQSARGFSIAVLMNKAILAENQLDAYKKLAGQGTDALKKHNDTVSAQNSAIEKANAQLRQLAGERDDAIEKLNTLTREFNELVEKYNKLGRR